MTHPHIPIEKPHQKAWAKWLLVATSLDAIRIGLAYLGAVLRSGWEFRELNGRILESYHGKIMENPQETMVFHIEYGGGGMFCHHSNAGRMVRTMAITLLIYLLIR